MVIFVTVQLDLPEVSAEHPNVNEVLTGLRLADVETSPPEMMDDEEESPSSVIHL